MVHLNKNNILSRIEIYINGSPVEYKSYTRNRTHGGQPDTTNYLIEFINFNRKYNETRGTFHYIFYFNGKPKDQYWYRKIKSKWKMVKIKE